MNSWISVDPVKPYPPLRCARELVEKLYVHGRLGDADLSQLALEELAGDLATYLAGAYEDWLADHTLQAKPSLPIGDEQTVRRG